MSDSLEQVAGPAHAADRTDLLLHAWELEQEGRLPELRALLVGLPVEVLAAEPDLGLLLTSTHMHLRELDRAERTLERIAGACLARPNDRVHRRYLTQSGMLLLYHGRLNESREVHGELMARSLSADDASTLLWSTMHLALIHHLKSEWPEAVALHHRALAAAPGVDGGKWRGGVQHNLAVTYRHMGLLDQSQRHFEESTRHLRPSDAERACCVERGDLMRLLGEHDVAESLCARAYAAYGRVDSPAGMANARMTLARVEMARGDLAAARAALDEAAALLPADEVVDWGELYEEVAVLESLDGRPGASTAARRRAADVYARMDAPRRIGNMLERLRGRRAVHLGVSMLYRGG